MDRNFLVKILNILAILVGVIAGFLITAFIISFFIDIGCACI